MVKIQNYEEFDIPNEVDLNALRKSQFKLELKLEKDPENLELLMEYKRLATQRFNLETMEWKQRFMEKHKELPKEEFRVFELRKEFKSILDIIESKEKRLVIDEETLIKCHQELQLENQSQIAIKDIAFEVKALQKRMENENSELKLLLIKFKGISKELLVAQINHWDAVLKGVKFDLPKPKNNILEALKRPITIMRKSSGNLEAGSPIGKTLTKKISATFSRTPKPLKNNGNSRSDVVRDNASLSKRISMQFSRKSNSPHPEDSTPTIIEEDNTMVNTELTAAGASNNPTLLEKCQMLKRSLTLAGITNQSLSLYNELVHLRARERELEIRLCQMLEPETMTSFEKMEKKEWKNECIAAFNECNTIFQEKMNSDHSDINELEKVNEEIVEMSKLLPVIDFERDCTEAAKLSTARLERLQKEAINLQSDYEGALKELEYVNETIDKQNDLINSISKEYPEIAEKYKLAGVKPLARILSKKVQQTHCVNAFKAQREGQIELEEGDLVQVNMTFTDGFCHGINITKETTGIFPTSCVSINKDTDESKSVISESSVTGNGNWNRLRINWKQAVKNELGPEFGEWEAKRKRDAFWAMLVENYKIE